MKKVLALYYSQTGQLTSTVRSFLGPLLDQKDVSIDFCPIIPCEKYPFPWTIYQFFDIFPETVQMKGVPIEPIKAKGRYNQFQSGLWPLLDHLAVDHCQGIIPMHAHAKTRLSPFCLIGLTVLLMFCQSALAQSPLKLTGVPNNAPQGFSRIFAKHVDVFGIKVYATAKTVSRQKNIKQLHWLRTSHGCPRDTAEARSTVTTAPSVAALMRCRRTMLRPPFSSSRILTSWSPGSRVARCSIAPLTSWVENRAPGRSSPTR